MRISWIVALGIILAMAPGSQAQEKEKIYRLEKAYVYQDASLLISETDLYCSFFIKDEFPDEMRVVGSEQMDTKREIYSDLERVYINKGENDGLHEGDMLLFISAGKNVRHPKTLRSLGRCYVKKSQGQITCLYKDSAGVTLKNGCLPVSIGDIVIPFKPEKTLFAKKVEYTMCRLPESPVFGNVVYIDMERTIMGTANHIAVDFGEKDVSKGTFLLFYRILKKNLPPLIIGSGIVLHPEQNNSTVKILDSANPIEMGDYAVILPAAKAKEVRPEIQTGEERAPTVEAGEIQEEAGAEASMAVDVLFAFDSKEIQSQYTQDIETIKNFVSSKSNYAVILRGYTCGIGSEEYNLKLSQERVEAIKTILVNQYGIAANQIETYFYGKKENLFDNSSEEQRRKNRLVKIEVIGK